MNDDAFTRLTVAWVGWVSRRAWWVVIASVALASVLFDYSLRTMEINTATEGMISEDLPFRRHDAAFRAAFPHLMDRIAIVIDARSPDAADEASKRLAAALAADTAAFTDVYAPRLDPFFRRNGLLFLDRAELQILADRLASAQPLLVKLDRNPTLAGFAEVLGEAARGIATGAAPPQSIDRVFAKIAGTVASVAAGDPRPLSWTELIDGKDATPAERRRFILVKPVLDYASLGPAEDAMRKIRAAARDLGLTPETGIGVRLTGGIAMSTEELQSVSRGAGAAGIVSLILVSAILAFGIRSWRLVAAILVTLVVGLVWTAGFTAAAIGHLNLISVAFAVLFIGLGVDFGIHYGLRFRETVESGAEASAAAQAATRGIAAALGLCTLAAAIGFLSFVPTDYTGLSELGLIAGAGMFIAFFTSLTLLPALLRLMPLKPRKARPKRPPAAERFLQRHGRAVSIVALLAGLAAAALLPWTRFDFDPIALKDPETESVRTFLELMAEPDTSPYTAELLAADLDTAADRAARLAALPEVDKTVTLASFVPEDQDGKLQILDDMAVFLAPLLQPMPMQAPEAPTDPRAAVKALAADLGVLIAADPAPALTASARGLQKSLTDFSSSGAETATLETALLRYLPGSLAQLRLAMEARQVTLDSLPARLVRDWRTPDGRARVQIYPVENLTDNDALTAFVKSVYTVAPDATDSPIEIYEAGRAVVDAIVQAALTALVVVTAMLLILLRSVRGTVLILLPLALAALMTTTATVVFNLPFNFANVIVLPLLMGLGVASGIHLVMRAVQDHGAAALSETSTPRAVVLSALTTIGSFGSLAVSSHRGTASMGELLTIAIACTLICTLFVLPALMAWIGPGRGARGGR